MEEKGLKGVADDICWFGFARELLDHHCSGCSRKGGGKTEEAGQQRGHNLALCRVQRAGGSSGRSHPWLVLALGPLGGKNGLEVKLAQPPKAETIAST